MIPTVQYVPNIGLVTNQLLQQAIQEKQCQFQPPFKGKNKKVKTMPANPAQNHRAGDWVCLLCSNLNYSFRTHCNRCKKQTQLENLRQGLNAYTSTSMCNKENMAFMPNLGYVPVQQHQMADHNKNFMANHNIQNHEFAKSSYSKENENYQEAENPNCIKLASEAAGFNMMKGNSNNQNDYGSYHPTGKVAFKDVSNLSGLDRFQGIDNFTTPNFLEKNFQNLNEQKSANNSFSQTNSNIENSDSNSNTYS